MPTAAFDRPNRLKAREEGTIKWGELLEKFKSVQEKARRAHQSHDGVDDGTPAISVANESSKEKALPEVPKQPFRPASAAGIPQKQAPTPLAPLPKPKGNLGRLARVVGDRNKGKK